MARKRVLVVSYSQSGQLTDVARSVAAPLMDDADVEVVFEELRPVKDYPYPWPFFSFLDVFPECVYMAGPELQPLSVSADDDFDLVILAYQVWFLSPALPITGFLQTDTARSLLKGKPVVTLIACRNMWLQAQEKMKVALQEIGAKLIDNIVLIDQGNSFATFVTTPRWMLTGRRDPFWGFPPAGVAEEKVTAASRFGTALRQALRDGLETKGEPLLRGLGAVEVNPKFILSEKAAHRGFRVWGGLLRKIGKPGSPVRKLGLLCYLTFLICFIVTFIPITVLIKAILSPFLKRRLFEQKAYYEAPSGSDASGLGPEAAV